MSYSSVVDELVNELAASRQARLQRNAAYLALARAILADEPIDLDTAEAQAA